LLVTCSSGGQKLLRGIWRLCLTFEDRLNRRVFPVQIVVCVLIEIDLRTLKICSRISSTRVRVAENGRFPAGTLGYTGTVASRSSGNSLRTEIPVSIYQFLLTLIVHQQHDFLMFAARLQTYAPACDGNERRSAPTTFRAATYHAIGVLTSHNESGFGQLRHHSDALGGV
jgi:hypothetical protein